MAKCVECGKCLIALRRIVVVPRKGFEPPLPQWEADFKSAASTIPPPGQAVRAVVRGASGSGGRCFTHALQTGSKTASTNTSVI